MHRVLTSVFVATTLVVTACSGDDDTAVTIDTTVAARASVAPTLPPSEVTSIPISTSSAIPTAAPTTTRTNDATPGTTTDENQAKQAVIEAAIKSWQSLNEALLDPTDEDRLAKMAATRVNEALDQATNIVVEDRSAMRRSITHPEWPAKVVPYPETITLDVNAGVASLEYCRLGSNIWVETGGNEDGSDLIIDDTINSYRERDEFKLVDGRWLKSGGVTLEEYVGAITCPAGA